ncbi:MAG: preprotein translocase subunit SecA [Pseudomonadaceae bacterium]|nr:preprotein translocase subunit SecA [Pseudomonadaceae bacterium]
MLSWVKGLAARVFGDKSSRYIKSIRHYVEDINALEADFAALNDAQLAAKTADFKARLAKGDSVDSLLVPAFAAVREAAKRALGLRMFDVQLMGGICLHQGKIAEMKTGEGKTLVATLPAYLNALSGEGVHVVTVNDYLAKRDAAWMGQVFAKLGLTTASIYHGQSPAERHAAYRADITYATNNELGFDYLRDNMALNHQMLVQRPLHYAIVDEVDSILIDESRTPLIISGPAEDKTELYQTVDALPPLFEAETDYEIDEKQRTTNLTDAGTDKAEAFLKEHNLLPADGNLYDVHNIHLLHHVQQALRAHVLFRRDVEYILKDNGKGPEVVLIDEFTGRMMPGRRLSDGLHQAIEAKEGVAIQQENQTMASITFQNYFRLYEKLAGMTGTALTEEEEFESIYGLEVIAMPTNIPVSRHDEADIIFRTREGKMKALIKDIVDCHQRGQPVLVGTGSIERSEEVAAALKSQGIPHAVLNARFHEQEAEIVAQAGRLGAVTIATNMAGRGTDIKLGGNLDLLLEGVDDEAEQARIKEQQAEEHAAVMEAGGLRVIGTERHESRRIDNQLRGRAGRQGDVGSSVFYISLQDDLIKRFAPTLDSLMARLNMPDDEAIQHPWIAKSIETAQRKIEGMYFDARKHVLKFDDVLNEQRRVLYGQRRELLHTEDLSETIVAYRHEMLADLLAAAMPPATLPEQWQPALLADGFSRVFNVDAPVEQWFVSAEDAGDVASKATQLVDDVWAAKTAEFPPAAMRAIERTVLLQMLDVQWRQHLQGLDYLRRGIGLRGYAQKDPINEYARESFILFEDMLQNIKRQTVSLLSRVKMVEEVPQPQLPPNLTVSHANEQGQMVQETVPSSREGVPAPKNLPPQPNAGGKASPSEANAADAPLNPTQNLTPQHFGLPSWDALHPLDARVPRNNPCPCGSGVRFKHCHGDVNRLKRPQAA